MLVVDGTPHRSGLGGSCPAVGLRTIRAGHDRAHADDKTDHA
jgi:hypothetical protein